MDLGDVRLLAVGGLLATGVLTTGLTLAVFAVAGGIARLAHRLGAALMTPPPQAPRRAGC
jgi:hypothetical protein